MVVLGCGEDTPATDEDSSGSSSEAGSSTVSASESSTVADSSSTSVTTSVDSSSTTGGAVCGDGVVEGDEPCDDGNDIDDDECSNDCTQHCALQWEVVIDPEPTLVQSIVQVVRDANGDLVMVATLESFDGDVPSSLWVAKYDAAGTEVWSGVRGPEGTTPAGVAVDDAGAIYVVGQTEAEAGDLDGLVLALDADGAEGWSRIIAGANAADDAVTGIAIADDGDLVIAGTIADVAMESDALVSKLAASDGSDVWTQTFTGTPAANGFSLDEGGHVAIDAAGDIIASWTLYVDFDSAPGALTKLAIADGTTIWDTHEFGGIGDEREEHSESLALGPDGEIVVDYQGCVGGQCFSNVYRVPADGMGGELFDLQQLMGENEETLYADGARFDDDGNLVLGGYFEAHASGELHAWIARLAPDGTTICQGRHREDMDGFEWIVTDTLAVGSGGAPVLGGGLIPTGGFVGTNDHAPMWLGSFSP